MREPEKLIDKNKPLVWMNKYGHVASFQNEEYKDPLYTEPPKREWVGLTDEEIDNLWEMAQAWNAPKHFYILVAAKLKEKNA